MDIHTYMYVYTNMHINSTNLHEWFSVYEFVTGIHVLSSLYFLFSVVVAFVNIVVNHLTVAAIQTNTNIHTKTDCILFINIFLCINVLKTSSYFVVLTFTNKQTYSYLNNVDSHFVDTSRRIMFPSFFI